MKVFNLLYPVLFCIGGHAIVGTLLPYHDAVNKVPSACVPIPVCFGTGMQTPIIDSLHGNFASDFLTTKECVGEIHRVGDPLAIQMG